MRPHHLMACLLAAAPITTALAIPATVAPPCPDTSTQTATTTAGLTISLRSPHERQLSSYAAMPSSPGNNRCRQYLTTAQLSQRFSARPGAVTRVSIWARAAGFRVGTVDVTGTRLPLTGTAAMVTTALGPIGYDTVQDGVRDLVATAVRLPPRIAGDVAVTGLGAPRRTFLADVG